jgi:hypothetical protein
MEALSRPPGRERTAWPNGGCEGQFLIVVENVGILPYSIDVRWRWERVCVYLRARNQVANPTIQSSLRDSHLWYFEFIFFSYGFPISPFALTTCRSPLSYNSYNDPYNASFVLSLVDPSIYTPYNKNTGGCPPLVRVPKWNRAFVTCPAVPAYTMTA